MKFLLMFDSSVTLKCFLQYKINVVFFLAEAFRIKEFKLKNLVLFKSKNWIGEYLCQMSSCSKIVRKSDEVSHYIIWFDILYVVSVLLYHFPYIICLNKKYVAPKTINVNESHTPNPERLSHLKKEDESTLQVHLVQH